MEKFDKAIVYNSKLNEVKSIIKRLQDMSINTTKLMERVNLIEQRIEHSVNNNYSSFEQNGNIFLHDSLENSYNNAIKELYALYFEITNEWSSYFEIHRECQSLREKLNTVDDKSLPEIINLSKELLDMLKQSSTIDYNAERDIVLEVYNLVYKSVQIELAYTGNSELLDYVKMDSVNIPYLVDELKKDISNLDDQNKEKFNERIVQLEKGGLDIGILLDKDLILNLALLGNKKLFNKKKKEFLINFKKFQELHDETEKLKVLSDELEEKITTLLSQKRKYAHQKLGKRALIFLNTILLSAGLTVVIGGTRELSKTKDYKTITSVYDSSTDELEVEESYENGKNESISLVEYSPWNAPGYFRDWYERTVYTYDVSNLGDITDVEDILDEKNKNSVTYTEERETSEEKPSDYGYGENKYIVKHATKDLNDYHSRVKNVLWAVLATSGSVLFTLFNIGLFADFCKGTSSLKLLKENSKQTNQEIKETRLQREDTIDSLEETRTNEEKVGLELERAYEDLPDSIKDLAEVQKAQKKVLTLRRNK